jgi:hypothetical protein
MQSSPPSPPPWSPPSRPEVENEHRLTVLEKDADHIRYRMSLHEKAIIFLAGLLYVLYQDKFPELAKLIRQAMP